MCASRSVDRTARATSLFVCRAAIGATSHSWLQYAREPRLEGGVLDPLSDDSELQRLVGGYHPLLEQEAQRALVSESLQQGPRHAAVGRGPRPRVAGVEASARAAKTYVRTHGQSQARTDGNPIHPGNNRLVAAEAHHQREPPDPTEIVHQCVLLRERTMHVSLPRWIADEIHARTEGVARPGQRDDAHRIVLRRLLHGCDERPAERVVQCVLALGPIEA